MPAVVGRRALTSIGVARAEPVSIRLRRLRRFRSPTRGEPATHRGLAEDVHSERERHQLRIERDALLLQVQSVQPLRSARTAAGEQL